jgi:hypothetical protein
MGTLLNPPRLIYVHREVGKRDSETKERKPVEFCMSRTGRGKNKIFLETVDNITQGDVVFDAGGEVDPHSKTNTQLTQLTHNLIGDRKMPFLEFDKSKLAEKFPSTFGRGTGKPSVNVGGNGRIQFSVLVSAAFEGCKLLGAAFEASSNRIRLEGFPTAPKGKEAKVWEIVRGKEGSKNKTCSISASVMLKEIGYDYKTAGNQTFDIEKQDDTKHVVIFQLPKETPTKKAVAVRKKKVVAAPATPPVNGSPTGPVAVASAPSSAASRATMGQKPPATAGEGDDVVIDE